MPEIRTFVPPQSSIVEIVDRYDRLLSAHEPACEPDPGMSPGHIRWMISEIRKGEMPPDKLHRWLGFVQGIMTSMGLIRVPEEREITRPLLTHRID